MNSISICSKNYICQGQVHYQKERVDTSLPMNEKVLHIDTEFTSQTENYQRVSLSPFKIFSYESRLLCPTVRLSCSCRQCLLSHLLFVFPFFWKPHIDIRSHNIKCNKSCQCSPFRTKKKRYWYS